MQIAHSDMLGTRAVIRIYSMLVTFTQLDANQYKYNAEANEHFSKAVR